MEKALHEKVCWYLANRYPEIIFNTDMSGIKLTIGQARKLKRLRSSRAFPDIVIYQPRTAMENRVEFGEHAITVKTIPVDYYVLFIELKDEGTRLILKDGSLSKDKHIQEQAEMLRKLQKLGYYADFAVGFEEAQKLIDWYLGGGNEPKKYIKEL